jgi:hypothetical protein
MQGEGIVEPDLLTVKMSTQRHTFHPEDLTTPPQCREVTTGGAQHRNIGNPITPVMFAR